MAVSAFVSVLMLLCVLPLLLMALGMPASTHAQSTTACGCTGCQQTQTVSSTLWYAPPAATCPSGQSATVKNVRVQSTDGSVFEVCTSTTQTEAGNGYCFGGGATYSNGAFYTTTCFNSPTNMEIGGYDLVTNAVSNTIGVLIVCKNTFASCPLVFDVQFLCESFSTTTTTTTTRAPTTTTSTTSTTPHAHSGGSCTTAYLQAGYVASSSCTSASTGGACTATSCDSSNGYTGMPSGTVTCSGGQWTGMFSGCSTSGGGAHVTGQSGLSALVNYYPMSGTCAASNAVFNCGCLCCTTRDCGGSYQLQWAGATSDTGASCTYNSCINNYPQQCPVSGTSVADTGARENLPPVTAISNVCTPWGSGGTYAKVSCASAGGAWTMQSFADANCATTPLITISAASSGACGTSTGVYTSSSGASYTYLNSATVVCSASSGAAAAIGSDVGDLTTSAFVLMTAAGGVAMQAFLNYADL
jgi:hypothetical protein